MVLKTCEIQKKVLVNLFNLSNKTLKHINGWSNIYYGWGGEDWEVYYRLAWAQKVTNEWIKTQTKDQRYLEMNPYNIVAVANGWTSGMIDIHFQRVIGGEKGNEKNEKRLDLMKNYRMNELEYDLMLLSFENVSF